MCHTDEECVRLCLDRDPEMFRHLVLRYQVPLMKYLVGRLGDENDAAEAAQETMVRAYFALRKLKKRTSFYSWLLGIAGRVAKEMDRAQRRHIPLNVETVQASTEPASDHGYHSDRALTRAVAELPHVCQEVILMRFYGKQSCAEISRNLRVPLGTVTSRLSRAYSLLRKRLRKQSQIEDVEVGP